MRLTLLRLELPLLGRPVLLVVVAAPLSVVDLSSSLELVFVGLFFGGVDEAAFASCPASASGASASLATVLSLLTVCVVVAFFD